VPPVTTEHLVPQHLPILVNSFCIAQRLRPGWPATFEALTDLRRPRGRSLSEGLGRYASFLIRHGL